jgi:uncharacterized protein (DUF2237 family)
MTPEFLEFSKSGGKDLSTPQQELGSPGLKSGDVALAASPRSKPRARVVPRATREGAWLSAPWTNLRRLAIDLT